MSFRLVPKSYSQHLNGCFPLSHACGRPYQHKQCTKHIQEQSNKNNSKIAFQSIADHSQTGYRNALFAPVTLTLTQYVTLI